MTTTLKNSIKKLHITEKASVASEKGVYVFQVEKEATKSSITKQIISAYKVTPVKVNIVNSKPKKVVSKGKVGQTRGVKKAYVYLKKGDTIDIA